MSENESTESEPEVVVAAASVTDGAYTLFVADFADTSTAWEAYEALKAAEDGRSMEIEGVIVVKREADGKLEVLKATDHSTRHDLKWGLVGGVALGLIFRPRSSGAPLSWARSGRRRERPANCTTAASWPRSSSPASHLDIRGSSGWSRTRVPWRSARHSSWLTPSSRPRSTTWWPVTSRRPPRTRSQSRERLSSPERSGSALDVGAHHPRQDVLTNGWLALGRLRPRERRRRDDGDRPGRAAPLRLRTDGVRSCSVRNQEFVPEVLDFLAPTAAYAAS